MSSQLIPFQFNTSSIRVVTTDMGDILFVASDVAKTLGYDQPHKAVVAHCKKAKSLIDIDGTNHTVEQNQELAKLDVKTKLIPESDVYRLVMRSKLESAEKFQDWLVEEVIPSIRKTGSYSLKPAFDTMTALSDPATMRSLLLGYTEKVLALEEQVKIIQPKANAMDKLRASEGCMAISDAAKIVGVKRDEFFELLNNTKWIFKRSGVWLGYGSALKKGLVEHRPVDAGGRIRSQCVITPRGLSEIAIMLDSGVAL